MSVKTYSTRNVTKNLLPQQGNVIDVCALKC